MNWLLVPVFAFILALSVFVTLAILHGVGGFLWDEHRWLLISGVVAVVAFLLHLFHRKEPASQEHAAAVPLHSGIRLHAIPVGGPMGFVFAVGFVLMFWFGLPGLRPLVLVLAGVGLVLGGVLLWLDQRRAKRGQAPPSILQLTSQPDRAGAAPPEVKVQ